MSHPRSSDPKRVTEATRSIDVVHETDVLVVGSGPGGLGAALGAARAGVGRPCSSATAASAATSPQVGVEGFAWYRHERTVDSEGIGRELEERAKAMGAAVARAAVDQPGARRRDVQVRRGRAGRGGRRHADAPPAVRRADRRGRASSAA